VAAQIVGRDISTRVIDIAQANAVRAGLGELLGDGRLRFEASDVRSGPSPAGSGMIVSNPPYGEQSQPRSASVASLMQDVAAQLKREFAGWQVWLISADRELPKQLRLKESSKQVLFNGALECRFFRFAMVAGANRRAKPGTESDTAA
jgi:putative N6-adenine-specific DNA methylase